MTLHDPHSLPLFHEQKELGTRTSKNESNKQKHISAAAADNSMIGGACFTRFFF